MVDPIPRLNEYGGVNTDPGLTSTTGLPDVPENTLPVDLAKLGAVLGLTKLVLLSGVFTLMNALFWISRLVAVAGEPTVADTEVTAAGAAVTPVEPDEARMPYVVFSEQALEVAYSKGPNSAHVAAPIYESAVVA